MAGVLLVSLIGHRRSAATIAISRWYVHKE